MNVIYQIRVPGLIYYILCHASLSAKFDSCASNLEMRDLNKGGGSRLSHTISNYYFSIPDQNKPNESK